MRKMIYVKDQKIYDHIISQDNASKYICDLVEYDMTNNKPLTREEVLEMIKKYSNSGEKNSDDKIKSTLTSMFK